MNDQELNKKNELIETIGKKLMEFMDNTIPEQHEFGRINIAINVLSFTMFNIIAPSLKTKKDLEEFLETLNNQYNQSFKIISKKRREKKQ